MSAGLRNDKQINYIVVIYSDLAAKRHEGLSCTSEASQTPLDRWLGRDEIN
jgi:hypothetical protein